MDPQDPSTPAGAPSVAQFLQQAGITSQEEVANRLLAMQQQIDNQAQQQQSQVQFQEAVATMRALQAQLSDAMSRVQAAEQERRDALRVAAAAVGSDAGNFQGGIVDSRGVGQPFKYNGGADQDFSEWSHKVTTYLKAKFGFEVEKALKWAVQQRKTVVERLPGGALASTDGRQIAFDPVYGEQADEMDRIPNLSKTVVGIYTYLIAFTTGDSNKIVRNAGSDAGLEAWRRLHNEYDPTSAMRRVTILGLVQNPPKCEKIENLGSALEDWLAKKRQYEEFTDQRGRPCRISDDSLMAAMYKLMPTSLEQQVMFHSDEHDSFEDLYDRLVAYASTKHSLKMTDKPVGSRKAETATPMDVDALVPKGKGSFKGKCNSCGRPGHRAADCRAQGGAGAGKSKSSTTQEHEGWGQDEWDGWWSSSWSEQPASEPPAKADQQAGGIGSLDLNHLESLAESVTKMSCSSVESYKVQWRGAEWLKLNYDSGAATTAIPDELIEGPLEARGEFIVASGEEIPNFGRFRVPAVDANGKRRSFAAYATKVHKPLGSAAEFSSTHDCVLWAEGGALIPKNSAVALGLRKEYYRLKHMYGDCDEIPLYREGNLYNLYLKQDGVPQQLSPLQEASSSSGASAADGRQSGNGRQVEGDNKLVRYHVSLRRSLFSPHQASSIPVNGDLILGSRTTEAIFEDGSVETVEDDWTTRRSANRRLKARWFGRTIFTFRREQAEAAAAERKQGLGWPTEEEERAAGGEAADSDPPHEESEEFRKSRAAAEPTPEQRENHFLENHAVYRPWCEVCVKSRGLGTQHRRALKKEATESSEGPRIFSDYFFMSTDEDSVPMLALKFSRSKRIAATALPRKGISELGCKFMSNFIKMTGVKRFVNFSDGEPAMKALKEESARKVAEVEAIPRECPVGDHQKNGEIESAVRELKRQMRAVRMSLEGRLGRALADDDPLLMWIPTFAGDCIAFHRRGADGKTPWERETGRKWRRPCLEFGEKVMIKEAYDSMLGIMHGTGAVMGLTSEGVKFGTGVSRLAASERWSVEGLEELRGLPWDLQPRLREARAVVGAEGVSVPRFPYLPSGSPAPRSFYVTREDVKPEKYGYTGGCRSCDNIMRLMERDENIRVKEYHNRVPESPSKRPVPASQWEQEGHGRYRKRQAEMPAEVLQVRVSESVPSEVTAEPPAAQIAVEASAPASAESGPASVEDFLKEEAADIDSLVAYEVLGSTVELGEQKNELIAAASEQVRKVYQHEGISLSSLEVRQIAALQVGIAGCRVREIFSRDGLSRAAPHFGLRPGFVLDLTGPRPSGPSAGKQWCLDKEEDTAELQQLISDERPLLVTGSSRHDLSQLLGTRPRGGPEQTALRTEKAQKQFRACVRFYRKQHEEQRSFLHEHPAGAASWQDRDMLALQSLPGVYTVE
ncbi:unnamed protein product, partial [Symbiodinium sp. CCMP2456]